MSIEKPANERLNLYNRFKESLRSGDDSTFFDADDLVIIIDQAVDLQDEFTEIEALMRGYRFFPDNEELAARRGFLYYDLNLNEGVDNARAQLPADSVMAKILRIRRIADNPDSQDEVRRLLNEIADDPELLDDEEMIQLVDCAAASENIEWLHDKTIEKKLRKKTDYLPTLLYELFIVSDMYMYRDYCLRLLEELTELQPFNIDFWNALAQVQATAVFPDDGNQDDALNSLDFALAIDSKNPEALTLKASILLKKGDLEAALSTLQPIVNPPAIQPVASTYVCILIAMERTDEAIEAITRFLELFPNDQELVNFAVRVNHPQINQILERRLYSEDEGQKSVKEWIEWAGTFYREGDLKAAITILEFLHNAGFMIGEPDGYRLLFSALYASEKYLQCIGLYTELELTNPNFLITEMILATLMSYIRLGNKADTKKALKEIAERLPMTLIGNWTMATAIESIGMSNFLAAAKSMINGRGDMKPELLDIFAFPYKEQ